MGEAKPHHPETHTVPPGFGAGAEQRFHCYSSGNHLGIAEAAAVKPADNAGKTAGRRKRHPHWTGRNVFSNRQRLVRFDTGRNGFFIRAVRRQRPHPAITEFRLCKEFGWTPTQLGRQPARTVHQFTIILNEVDREAEEERRRAEREAKRHER